MRGRSAELGEGNGFLHGGRRGRDREIRPAACREKPLRRIKRSVPQTDTGGRVEHTQALG